MIDLPNAVPSAAAVSAIHRVDERFPTGRVARDGLDDLPRLLADVVQKKAVAGADDAFGEKPRSGTGEVAASGINVRTADPHANEGGVARADILDTHPEGAAVGTGDHRYEQTGVDGAHDPIGLRGELSGARSDEDANDAEEAEHRHITMPSDWSTSPERRIQFAVEYPSTPAQEAHRPESC